MLLLLLTMMTITTNSIYTQRYNYVAYYMNDMIIEIEQVHLDSLLDRKFRVILARTPG